MPSTNLISIVAGGWSVSQIAHRDIPGFIIAVNDSAFYLETEINEVVSMDRLWTEHRWDWLKRRQIMTQLRRSAVQNLTIPEERWWLNIFDCDHETAHFSKVGPHLAHPPKLNGMNSAECALNLAFLARPKTLLLFGFDMQNGPNGELQWHPPYPWADKWKTSKSKFNKWRDNYLLIDRQFKSIGTKVYNVSSHSKIDIFPKLEIADAKCLTSTSLLRQSWNVEGTVPSDS